MRKLNTKNDKNRISGLEPFSRHESVIEILGNKKWKMNSVNVSSRLIENRPSSNSIHRNARL